MTCKMLDKSAQILEYDGWRECFVLMKGSVGKFKRANVTIITEFQS